MTLPTTILARIRRGITPEINSIGVLVMLVTIILLALATVVSGQLVPGQKETER
jgi:ABC-type spermidine/putrescine transport system permease subunit II